MGIEILYIIGCIELIFSLLVFIVFISLLKKKEESVLIYFSISELRNLFIKLREDKKVLLELSSLVGVLVSLIFIISFCIFWLIFLTMKAASAQRHIIIY